MPEAPVLRDVYGKIRVVELQWIPMADGRRLAARLWLPNDAEQKPVPAVLEYIPYRRRDGTRVPRRRASHAWMAAPGLCLRPRRHHRQRRFRRPAARRISEAGAGRRLSRSSPGWRSSPGAAAAVGMIGISWGGFNGLQVAAASRRR